MATKREYRGARSVDAFVAYIKDQATSRLRVVHDNSQLVQAGLENKKRNIVGFFHADQTENYKVFDKLASLLRDSCNFIAAVSP